MPPRLTTVRPSRDNLLGTALGHGGPNGFVGAYT